MRFSHLVSLYIEASTPPLLCDANSSTTKTTIKSCILYFACFCGISLPTTLHSHLSVLRLTFPLTRIYHPELVTPLIMFCRSVWCFISVFFATKTWEPLLCSLTLLILASFNFQYLIKICTFKSFAQFRIYLSCWERLLYFRSSFEKSVYYLPSLYKMTDTEYNSTKLYQQ